MCDQISAALLKAYVAGDKQTRAGIEVLGGKGIIVVSGEVTSSTIVDVDAVVKRVLADVGYRTDYQIINNIGLQSKDIAMGVDTGGAGDQGMMFGYACDDTQNLLPTAMCILQDFAQYYDELRQRDHRFLPDGKAQITGVYDDSFRLAGIKDFTVSYQNTEIEREATDAIIRDIIDLVTGFYGIFDIDKIHINPTGKFQLGGFDADVGLTGRKIVVDAYQSFANVGGGCMNGKDCTKVDFSAAHKARQIACECLEAKGLRWCEVQLSYAIGLDKPLAIYIDSDQGNIEPYSELYEECTPANIIRDLRLYDADYEQLAKYGHFTCAKA